MAQSACPGDAQLEYDSCSSESSTDTELMEVSSTAQVFLETFMADGEGQRELLLVPIESGSTPEAVSILLLY